MKKFLAGISAAVILAAGGVALVGLTSDVANAQEGETTTEEAEARHRHPHKHRGLRVLAVAADEIGISVEDLINGVNDGNTVSEVAEANGSSGDAVVDAVVAKLSEKIDTAVENGRFTEDEGAQKLADATARLEAWVDDELDLPEPGQIRRAHRGLHGLKAAADAIGITVRDLVSGINEGNTIAQVAEANGSSGDEVIATMTAAIAERIDEAVANGDKTAEEGEALLARATEKITEFVNAELDLPERGPRGFRQGPPAADTTDA